MDDRSHDHRTEPATSEHPTPSPHPSEGGSGAAKAATATAGAAAGAIATGTAGTIVGGPIGTIVGAIAGAIGGGWVGLASGTAADEAPDREALYRRHYESFPSRPADVPYERARPAYELGAYARRNPDYTGRSFAEIEPDLRAGWTDEVRRSHGDWETVRPLVRAAYEGNLARERGATFADENLGGSASHQRASYSDPIPQYVDPVESSTGQDVAGSRDIARHDEDPWVRDPVDQGGFGSHPSVPLKRESPDQPAS